MTPTQRNSLRYVYREEEMTMMTVNEVSKLTGVSIRTLQYYDTIGLLKPIEYTESGYRLYDDTSLERLQQILLFKELEFPLKINGISAFCSRASVLKKYGSHRLCDGCLSIIGKINLLIDKWIIWA